MKIVNYTKNPEGSKIFATFDLYFETSDCHYRNFKVIRSKNGNFFACAPSFKQIQTDGSEKYVPYIEFSTQKSAEFYKKILDLLRSDGHI